MISAPLGGLELHLILCSALGLKIRTFFPLLLALFTTSAAFSVSMLEWCNSTASTLLHHPIDTAAMENK